jgi:hypothetical protein
MQQSMMMKNKEHWRLTGIAIFILLASLYGVTPVAQAGNTLCAEVNIEIQQELALERQAFEAHRRINHGLTKITLQNVGVLVDFINT